MSCTLLHLHCHQSTANTSPISIRRGRDAATMRLLRLSGVVSLACVEHFVLWHREALAVGEPVAAKADWSRPFEPDPVFLFRFSALTYNSQSRYPLRTGLRYTPRILSWIGGARPVISHVIARSRIARGSEQPRAATSLPRSPSDIRPSVCVFARPS